jgi:hypothetical protein
MLRLVCSLFSPLLDNFHCVLAQLPLLLDSSRALLDLCEVVADFLSSGVIWLGPFQSNALIVTFSS